MSPALVPLVALLVVVGVDAWVYFDATAQVARGTPVVFSLGGFVVDTPQRWVGCCLLLFVIFFPLYLVGRAA